MSVALDHRATVPPDPPFSASTPMALVPPPARDPDPPDPDARPPGPGLGVVELEVMRAAVERATWAGAQVGLSEAELVDEIAALETLGSAVAALQADRMHTFAVAHAASQADTQGGGLDPRRLERSIAAQVGSACGVSPHRGRTRLRTARDLHRGLEYVRDLHTRGRLSAEKTQAVVAATADLEHGERARVDAQLAEHDLATLGVGRLRDLALRLVAQVAPETFRARAAAARRDRRVTLRPGGDGMCWLSAHLPIEQGAACLAALNAAVTKLWADATAVVTRSRGQTMADTLVERLTGQATAETVDAEIQAIVPVEALLDPECELPAVVPGLGPVPLDRLLSQRAGRLALRRLITRAGVVIGGDSRRRGFTGVLADLLKARDNHRCREPYCDAPIRHLDHVTRHTEGGETAFDNGRGVCAFHNYLREQPGWTVRTNPEGSITTTTPTGHTYTSRTARIV